MKHDYRHSTYCEVCFMEGFILKYNIKGWELT